MLKLEEFVDPKVAGSSAHLKDLLQHVDGMISLVDLLGKTDHERFLEMVRTAQRQESYAKQFPFQLETYSKNLANLDDPIVLNLISHIIRLINHFQELKQWYNPDSPEHRDYKALVEDICKQFTDAKFKLQFFKCLDL